MKRPNVWIIFLCSFCLTGCGNQVDLTQSETAIISEYIAGTVLKHDKNYDKELIYSTSESETVPSSQPSEEPSSQEQSSKTDTDTKGNKKENIVDAQTLYGNNLNVEYKKYSFYSSYPENNAGIVPITAAQGNKLLVIKFQITNKSNGKKHFNLLSENIKYQININVDKVYKPYFTILENDFQFLDTDIDAKQTKEAVLVFEIPKNIKIKNMDLSMTRKGNTAFVKLK